MTQITDLAGELTAILDEREDGHVWTGAAKLLADTVRGVVENDGLFLAIIDTKYRVFAIAGWADEAKAAACRQYRATFHETERPRHGGKIVSTDAQIEAYFGVNVYGPIKVPGAITE
jgi:hypothetical protein